MSPVSFSLNISFGAIQASNFQLPGPQGIPSTEAMTPPGPRGLKNELKLGNNVEVLALHNKGSLQRVKEVVRKFELSVSSYDTAWVGMLPSPKSSEVPCFPECTDWNGDTSHAKPSTVYPLDIYTHLCWVDSIEKLGIAEYFRHEIKSILDRVYRYWVQNDGEITSDAATCAIAFRFLRLSGYDVSSGNLAQFYMDYFQNTLQGHIRDTGTVLQLYKASQVQILPNEPVLEKLNAWSRQFLEEELSKNAIHGCQVIYKEVEYALKFPPYANLQRLEHKQNIENYNIGNIFMLKKSYTLLNLIGKDLLGLALELFNISQSVYQKELEYLNSWVKENRLDQLKFARLKQTFCYFSASATLFSPKMSDARLCWAKNGVLATIVDDFFDIGGSREEHLNLIALVEKWDFNNLNEFYSEPVKIIFSALYSTINELGSKASILQKRSVIEYMVDIWLDLLRSVMREADWTRNRTVPSMDEYMTNGYVSFGFSVIIEPTLFFVGPELSEDILRQPEYRNLVRLANVCGRLLNDIQSFEREGKEGKLNSVSLQILYGRGSITEEEAKKKARSLVDSSRRELLRLVLASEGSVVPRACKDLFWNATRACHLFYMHNDGYTSASEMVGFVNAVINEPLQVTHLFSEIS